MKDRSLELAALVIERADRDHPADGVLRFTLKSQQGLSRELGRTVARLVFAYYRWFGWLDPRDAMAEQLRQSARWAAEFAQNPSSFPERDLLAKAVPGWTSLHFKVADDYLRALQREPTLWLRARPGQGRHLAAQLGLGAQDADDILTDALAYEGPLDLFRTSEFQGGQFELQDISSQAVGWLCAPAPGETWWDAFAGEGGKTLHLADLMNNKGLVWASDRAPWRLESLKRRAARARLFNYRTVLWSGRAGLPTKTRFDGVLVDAPCSGIGTWQRNPHARWTSSPEDVRELAAKQQELLARVAAAVKPGGKLVYAVCTLTRAETVEIAVAFQTAFPEFTPLAVLNPLERQAVPAAQQWFWPQDRGGNGMFVAAWRKKDSR